MALTGAQLTDEVQVLIGRANTDPLVDDTRCARWLNEGQEIIIETCPGLKAVGFKNTTSLDTTQVLAYNLSDITVGDLTTQKPCHIFNCFYMDGNESIKLTFLHQDEFDEKYPDPTSSDYAADKPKWWILRGQTIEMFPLCATAYCDKNLRFDGDYYPKDMTTNSTYASDLSRADAGLIFYATAQAWAAIGNEDRYAIQITKFENWLDKYQAKNEICQGWDGNLFSDDMEI